MAYIRQTRHTSTHTYGKASKLCDLCRLAELMKPLCFSTAAALALTALRLDASAFSRVVGIYPQCLHPDADSLDCLPVLSPHLHFAHLHLAHKSRMAWFEYSRHRTARESPWH